MTKDARKPRRPGVRWKFIFAGVAFAFVAIGAVAANAQIGGDLVPPLPVSTELPNTGPTPTSTPPPPDGGSGVPIGGITSPLASAVPSLPKSDPLGDPLGLLGGDDQTQPTPNPNTTTKPGQVTDPTSPVGGASGPSAKTTPTGGPGGTTTVTPGTADAPSFHYGVLPGGSYGSVARRAAVSAAGRAIDLAGPLAPPLIIAAAMLLLLAALGRGNDRFGKFEHVTLKRAYRL